MIYSYLIGVQSKIVENSMRTLLLLITCLGLSLYQIEKFTVEKSDLFLDRVSSKNFNYHYEYLHFSADSHQIRMHGNTTESLQVLTLDSVYTSSKAVYKTQTGKYIGFVLVDSSIYMTKSTDSIMTIDFDTIYFFGVQEKLLL